MPKLFQVYNKKTGCMVVEGGAKKCCEWLGVGDTTFRDAAKRGGTCRGVYQIIDCSDESEEKQLRERGMDFVKSWDALCEPLRKKYGIPVYKPEVSG